MKKLLTIAGVLVIVAGVAGFNQWYRLRQITDLHTQMAKAVRQSLIERGIRPISWELLSQTMGAFESIPAYPPEVKELAGKQITIVGYGAVPRRAPGDVAHDGHNHASMLPLPLTVLDLVLGHVHTREYRGTAEFLLTPLPTECYWRRLAPLNQVIYVRTAHPVDFADGAAIALTGRLELREQEGPKFFYVLKDAELIK